MFSTDIASVQSGISQARILLYQNVGRKFHKSRVLGKNSIALVSIQTWTNTKWNRRGNKDFRYQVKNGGVGKMRDKMKKVCKFFQISGHGQILDKCFKSGCGMQSWNAFC